MCDWKALRAQLAVSDFLEPGDDLTTQRGIIATAIAITERMSFTDRMHHVSWQPVRLRSPLQAPEKAVETPKPAAGGPGGLLVKASPEPRLPQPGGAAVKVPANFDPANRGYANKLAHAVPEVADPWF